MKLTTLIAMFLCTASTAACVTEAEILDDTADHELSNVDLDLVGEVDGDKASEAATSDELDLYSHAARWFCIVVHRDCDDSHPAHEPGSFEPRCDSDYYLGSGEHRWQARHQALHFCYASHPHGCDVLKCERDTF